MNRRGASLIELLITVGVYTFLVISLFAITRDGTASWRAVEARSSAQTSLRIIERDLMTELKRGSYTSVSIKQDTYQHAIVFKSSMNETDVTISNVLGDPTQFWVKTSGTTPVPVAQRYILYYVTRLDPAEHLATFGFNCDTTHLSSIQSGSPTIRDDICPHKLLVRKDIYLSAKLDDKSTLVAPYIEGVGNEPRTAGLLSEPHSNAKISRVRVLSREVLAFNLFVITPAGAVIDPDSTGALPANGAQLEVDVKTFKSLEASAAHLTIGGIDLSASQFTLQLDNRVFPGNP